MKDEKTGDDLVSIGFVVELDYKDATTSAHDLLQTFKTHSLVSKILEGGERVGWGAKALPGGGYWSLLKAATPGADMVGDPAGTADTMEPKGVHHCIKSGMLARERISAAPKPGETPFDSYVRTVEESSVDKEIFEVRNARQPLQKGLLLGGPLSGVAQIAKGKLPRGRLSWHRNDSLPMFVGKTKNKYVKPDGKYTFDKLSS